MQQKITYEQAAKRVRAVARMRAYNGDATLDRVQEHLRGSGDDLTDDFVREHAELIGITP